MDYCLGLITIIHTIEKELYLAYFSVKEYLLGLDLFSITTASISITWTYLTYLTDINGNYREIIQNFPLVRRAAKLWAGSTTLCQTSEDLVRATITFLEKEAIFRR